MFKSSNTTLIISKDEMNDMKIVKSLGESGLLIQGIIQTIKMNQKNKKEGFFEIY